MNLRNITSKILIFVVFAFVFCSCSSEEYLTLPYQSEKQALSRGTTEKQPYPFLNILIDDTLNDVKRYRVTPVEANIIRNRSVNDIQNRINGYYSIVNESEVEAYFETLETRCINVLGEYKYIRLKSRLNNYLEGQLEEKKTFMASFGPPSGYDPQRDICSISFDVIDDVIRPIFPVLAYDGNGFPETAKECYEVAKLRAIIAGISLSWSIWYGPLSSIAAFATAAEIYEIYLEYQLCLQAVGAI